MPSDLRGHERAVDQSWSIHERRSPVANAIGAKILHGLVRFAALGMAMVSSCRGLELPELGLRRFS